MSGYCLVSFREKNMETTVQSKFQKYHTANPDVYKLFLQYAREVKAAGFTQYGAWAIMNRIRWHHDINKRRTDGFKISNDYIAWYARKALEDYPTEFKGFFKLKKLSRP
jgi:hypothetical protein